MRRQKTQVVSGFPGCCQCNSYQPISPNCKNPLGQTVPGFKQNVKCSSLNHGIMRSQSHEIMESYNHTTLESQTHGIMKSWNHGITESWNNGVIEL